MCCNFIVHNIHVIDYAGYLSVHVFLCTLIPLWTVVYDVSTVHVLLGSENKLYRFGSSRNRYYYYYYYYGNYELNDEEISHIHQTITAVHNTAVVMATRKLRKNRWLDSPMHVSSHGQWWSKRRTQRPQSSQWRARRGCFTQTHHSRVCTEPSNGQFTTLVRGHVTPRFTCCPDIQQLAGKILKW